MTSILLCFLMAFGCSTREDDKRPVSPPEKEKPDQTSLDSATAIYRQFFFTGTHNSYSGNLDGMKREGIKTQLERGLRFFEFDLFSYHTQNKLRKTWVADEFVAFDYQEKSHFLSYKVDGHLNVYRLTAAEPEMVYDNADNPLTPGERRFAVLQFESELYLFGYHPNSGDLTIYRFKNNTLLPTHTAHVGTGDGTLSTFISEGKPYLAIHRSAAPAYRIYALSLAAGETSVGETRYELASVPAGEALTPFVQGGNLYIFRHNINAVTSFSVAHMETAGEMWSIASSVRSNSDRLKGNVQACSANDGKLYVNAYAANGDVVGSQLVMDNGQPNLVWEYNNEIAVLSGAKARTYPAPNGYYLFLQNESDIQLSMITIGSLVLGHDAPGDEVDLDVDNPSSILFADWIAYIADWSNQHPNHEPLFIMTELKEYEQWVADAKWQNIIRLMQENFGAKLRYHSSSGFQRDSMVDPAKIVNGKTRYFMDENGSKAGGLLGKIILYIQPNNNITKSEHTNSGMPFQTTDGQLQENFQQLRRYREDNKLVSPDWRSPNNYGNNIGAFIDQKDDSYISRIFHMQSSAGDSQYDNIRCTDVMFAVSDRPFDQGRYAQYVAQQKVKNKLEKVSGCN